MKKQKLFLLILTSMILTFGLSSCSDDDSYSLGDFWVNLVKVNKDADGRVLSFTRDDGKTLFVAASNSRYIPKNERAIINYTILSDNYGEYDHAIKLNGYHDDVLTKPIIYVPKDDKAKQDSLGYDKIKVFSVWAKADYINIRFGFNMSGKDQHLLNLVAVDAKKEQDGDEPIKLEFRHNKNKDSENYASGDNYVCFKLDEYIAANKGKAELTFEVTWTEYNGTVKKEILKYPLPVK